MSESRDRQSAPPITIKKYANRRLYNTATSSYVTLDHLSQMVKEGIEFQVVDAKTKEDITRNVLTQIIVEEEAKGANLLPINFLRQLIGYYGDNLEWMVPRYLEHMMQSFTMNQERMRQTMQERFEGMFPFGNLEEMGRQNMAMFERAMSMWNPFAELEDKTGREGAPRPPARNAKEAAAPSIEDQSLALERLQKQISELQDQLERLAPKQPKD